MNRPIRVLHTLSAIASGGVEVRHLELTRNLVSPEFEHRFIGTTGGRLADQLEQEGTHVALLGPVGSIFAPGRYRKGLQLARAWRPDIIHGAVMEGTLLGAVVGRRLGVPVIVEETSDPANRKPMGHRLTRLVAASADRCVAVSPSTGRYLTDQLGVPSRKVQVIVNGVRRPEPSDPDERDRLRRSLGIASTDVVIGTVCRLFDDHKRVTDLVGAVAQVGTRHPEVHLVVVGSGPDRELMEEAARRSGYGGHIHFVGRHVPADDYYGIFDVFALASSREAFGLVAAEAMRAGLPVVATAVGGLGEIVLDGETGSLVPPSAPAQLAAALERLVADAALRRRMGEAGRVRADQDYSVERYVSDVEQLYRDVLRQAR
jgi:L-malate glycosyltransferase